VNYQCWIVKKTKLLEQRGTNGQKIIFVCSRVRTCTWNCEPY